MDFPEGDHNPPHGLPRQHEWNFGLLPRHCSQSQWSGGVWAFCWFPVLALPFYRKGELQQCWWGRSPEEKPFPCQAAGGMCWEKRMRALKPNLPPRAPQATEPHTGYQAHKTQLAFIRLLQGRLWTEPNHTFPLFPGIPTGSRKQVSIKLALPYHFHFCDRDSLSFWFIHSQMMALEKKTFRTQWKVDTWI